MPPSPAQARACFALVLLAGGFLPLGVVAGDGKKLKQGVVGAANAPPIILPIRRLADSEASINYLLLQKYPVLSYSNLILVGG